MMKKIIAVICFALFVTNVSFAQDAAIVEAPAAEAVQAVVTETAAMATEAAPMATETAPMAIEAAPMTTSIDEGTVVNAPIVSEYPVVTAQQGCGCCGTPVMSQSVVSAPVVSAPVAVAAAPMATDCGCGAPAAVAPACCPKRERRQIVRGAISSLRSRRSSRCCN